MSFGLEAVSMLLEGWDFKCASKLQGGGDAIVGR